MEEIWRSPPQKSSFQVFRNTQRKRLGAWNRLFISIYTTDLPHRLEGNSIWSQPRENRHSTLPQQVAASHEGRPDSCGHAVQADIDGPTGGNRVPNRRTERKNREGRGNPWRFETTNPSSQPWVLQRHLLGRRHHWKRVFTRLPTSGQAPLQRGQRETRS